MATLSDREKEEIVTLLARFRSPAQVVVHMREHWGVEVDRFQVRAYDPTNARYEGGDRWRPVFEAARAAYLGGIEDVPIAHAGYRLNELQRNYDRASQAGNLVLANAILRQAAWEAGRIPARDPRARNEQPLAVRDMTPEERRAKMIEILTSALAHRAIRPAEIAQGEGLGSEGEAREAA